MPKSYTTYKFVLKGGVTMAAWSFDLQFPNLDSAFSQAKMFMESFATNVYGVDVFRMDDAVNGVLMGTARLREPEAEVRLPLSRG
jgi:hypothetical protein